MLSLVASCALSLSQPWCDSGDWILVRGGAASVGSLSYERIGELYLGQALGAPFSIGSAA